ncbi:MAG: carboxypeptidase-like regulatory domain-containing protein, partial [Bacteroidales bacterium]
MKTLSIIVASLLISIHFIYLKAQPSDRPSGDMSERRGFLVGKILDEYDDKPLEFTSVAIFSESDSTLIAGGIAGPDGSFQLNGIPFGEYYLIANFMGYEKMVIEDIVISPDNRRLDIGNIELQQSVNEIDEVEIIADQAHVEYKIDRKVINVSQDI